MKNIFSISLITKNLVLSLRRFPISIFLVAGFASLLFAENNDLKKNIPYQLYLFFSLGAIISVTATLWLENFVNHQKQYIITAVIILLWGAYCFFLPEEAYGGKRIEIIVIGIAAFLSMFFISFLQKNKDKAFWNFTIQTLFQLGLAVLFGLVIFLGLLLAFSAIEQLFNIKIRDKVYGNLAIFCFVLFAPLYFLMNIPDKAAKHNEEMILDKFLKIFALYILMPIAMVYVAILYIYLFKIIFNWELPNGSVSWLVSVLAFSGLLIITLLYPVLLQGKNKFVVFLSRYFGLIILPLLVLMTIGIFRRIGDYGITIQRCNILLLNIWFYGVYTYLFIAKSQSIKWIPISFTAIALCVSTGFWSIANITKYTITAELNKYLDNKKMSLSDKTFFNNMEQRDKKKIRDKMKYLYSTYGRESIQPFFSDNLQNKYMYEILSDLRLHDIDDTGNTGKKFEYYRGLDDEEIWSLGKFNTFVYVNYRSGETTKKISHSVENNHFIIKIIPDNRVFSVPLKEIAIEQLESKSKNNNGKQRIFKGNDYTVLISEINGYYYETSDSVSINRFRGYLFYNK